VASHKLEKGSKAQILCDDDIAILVEIVEILGDGQYSCLDVAGRWRKPLPYRGEELLPVDAVFDPPRIYLPYSEKVLGDTIFQHSCLYHPLEPKIKDELHESLYCLMLGYNAENSFVPAKDFQSAIDLLDQDLQKAQKIIKFHLKVLCNHSDIQLKKQGNRIVELFEILQNPIVLGETQSNCVPLEQD
jgi:hypothetical protein